VSRRRILTITFAVSLLLLLIAAVWMTMELRSGYEASMGSLRTLADNGVAAMKPPDGTRKSRP